jgi:hypothetical protein
MTKYFCLFYLLILSNVSFGQNGYPKYYEMVALDAKADSLYKAKDFLNAAHYYTATANIEVEKVITMNYSDLWYDAACSWSLANVPDSAFSVLDMIVSKMQYSNYKHLLADPDFNSLHADSRWKHICDLTKANEEAKELQEKKYEERTTYQGKSKETIFYPHTPQMRKFIDNDSLPFLSVDYQNARIYFRGNSFAAYHLPAIRKHLDLSLKRIFAVVGISEFNRGVNLVMVDSAGELKELTGMYVHGGFSSQGNDEIFFVYNGEKEDFKHEIFHFISNNVWGFNRKSRLLNEGGAVYTEYPCDDDYSLYGISSYMLKENKLFSFESLINNFHEKEMESEERAYFESAAIFKYLYENYGIEKMKEIWLKGFDSFDAIYGITLPQFEKEWTAFISTVRSPKNLNWDKVASNTCE